MFVCKLKVFLVSLSLAFPCHAYAFTGGSGVSIKRWEGMRKVRYVQKPLVKAHLYIAVKILRLLKAGANQDAHMPPGEMAAVTRARRRHRPKDFLHKYEVTFKEVKYHCLDRKSVV